MSMRIRCRVDLPKLGVMLTTRNLEKAGKVQQAVDAAVIRYAIPYCPMKTGTLMNSPLSMSTPGKVIYAGPYAHYLYYGKVYGPNIPIFEDDSGVPTRWVSPPGKGTKHPTGKDLTYRLSPHENAGPFWIERMKADHINDIIEEVRKFGRDL